MNPIEEQAQHDGKLHYYDTVTRLDTPEAVADSEPAPREYDEVREVSPEEYERIVAQMEQVKADAAAKQLAGTAESAGKPLPRDMQGPADGKIAARAKQLLRAKEQRRALRKRGNAARNHNRNRSRR